MRPRFCCCVISCVFVLSGCSHIPNHADVPGVEPYHILQNVRCEIAGVLVSEYPDGDRYYDWVREADIAYGLTLRAEEKKTDTGSITWLWPIHLGTFSLNVNAGKERERTGENIVILAEELKGPLAMVEETTPAHSHSKPRKPIPCKSPHHTVAYPILGSIGMRDIIRQFVEVNSIAPTLKNYGAPTDDPFLASAGDGKFVHTLKFSLKFSGGIKPSFEIKRLDGSQFSGNADLNGHRLDYHELIIAMAPPTQRELEEAEKARRTKKMKGKRLRIRSEYRIDRQQNLVRQIQLQQYLQRLPLAPVR